MGTATDPETRHGFFTVAHVPTLAEVQPVPEAQIRAHGQYYARLLSMLQDLELHAHEDATGNYWFGRTDAQVAEHERWVYVIPQDQLLQGRDWNDTRYGTLEGCEGEYLMYANLDFLDEIEELHTIMEAVLYRLTADRDPAASDPSMIKAKVILMRRNCTYIGAPEMLQMIHATWDQELHDVLHHYDAWCERHEASGMPRSLALRMHGMEPYLRASATGWKWLKRIPAVPIE
jgi:hypothetical protein